MVEFVVPAVISISIVSIIGFIVIFYIYTRNKERTSIIEKGMSGEDLKSFLSPPKRKDNYPGLAKWAIAALGIGMALIIGAVIDLAPEVREPLTFGLALFLTGLGWMILHFMTSNKNEDAE